MLFAFEERAAEAVLGSLIAGPPRPGALAIRHEDVRWIDSLTRFMRAASAKARLGIRASLVIVWLAPVWMWGRLATLTTLAPAQRGALLDEMSRHRIFLIREMCLLLKLCACLAMFRDPEVRERSGYDPAPVSSSGRRSLPMASSRVEAA